MSIKNASTNYKLTKVADYSSANTSAIESSIVDMEGFESVWFFTDVNVADAGNFIKAQQDDASNMSSAADLLGTAVIVTGADEAVGIDLVKPEKRYVRAVVIRAGSSTTAGPIWALQYNGAFAPTDNITAGTENHELHVSPIEGTA